MKSARSSFKLAHEFVSFAREKRVQLLRNARSAARAERRYGRVMTHAVQHGIAALSSKLAG